MRDQHTAGPPPAQGLYRPEFEHDSCGVGFVAHIKGKRSHKIIEDADHRALYIFNHLEYDIDTLKQEYDRDAAAGVPIDVPHDYYPDDDPTRMPPNRWRSHAHLLYGNWINEIYQSTPYDLARIGTGEA